MRRFAEPKRERASDNRVRHDGEPKKAKIDVSGVINMIIGGNTYSKRHQKRARKEIYSLTKVEPIIMFGAEDGKHIRHPHNEALVISAYLNNYLVNRMQVDDESIINALSWEAYRAIGGLDLDLKPVRNPITNFYGGII